MIEMNGCTAGFARLDLNPPLGMNIIGNNMTTFADGIADPLYVNAVSFGRGDDAAVLVVCDLLGLYGDFGYQWPGRIADKLGLKKDAVFLCCTHTHTGPAVDADPDYFAHVFDLLCNAARQALDDRKPVTDVCTAEGEATGLICVRRYVMRDGSITTHPKSLSPDIVRHVSKPDESMRLIRIFRQDAPEIALVNTQTHPDCVGGTQYSADWPGVLRRRVEEVRGNVHCVLLNGTQGQLVTQSKFTPHIPKNITKATDYGKKLADVALSLFDRTASTGAVGLSYAQSTVVLRTRENTLPEATRIFALGSSPRPTPPDPYDLPVLVSAVTFCGVAFVGLPGEPYCEMGKHIRGYSAFPVTCVCCQANGSHGYFPTADAYGHPGNSYEPKVTHVCAGSAEKMMVAADELLRSLL